MSTTFRTLADLERAGCVMWLQCKGCDRISSRTPAQVSKQDPIKPDTSVLETIEIEGILPRLRCKRCGARSVEWMAMRGGFTGACW